jgi:hypothetical protein
MSGDKTIYRLVMGLVAAAVFAAGAWVYTRSDNEPPADPYQTYVAEAPEMPVDWTGPWPLSREDAQTRAILGCGQDWAPGTVDAVLQDAYEALCD